MGFAAYRAGRGARAFLKEKESRGEIQVACRVASRRRKRADTQEEQGPGGGEKVTKSKGGGNKGRVIVAPRIVRKLGTKDKKMSDISVEKETQVHAEGEVSMQHSEGSHDYKKTPSVKAAILFGKAYWGI